jgi:hypothetical protein
MRDYKSKNLSIRQFKVLKEVSREEWISVFGLKLRFDKVVLRFSEFFSILGFDTSKKVG